MRKVIRRNCFETNSSSMHSILVTKNDTHVKPEDTVYNKEKNEYPYDHMWISNGELWLHDISHGYGRGPFQILTTFKDKLMYAMCEYLGHLYVDDPEYTKYYNEFLDIVDSVLPESEEFEDFNIDTREIDIYLDENGNAIMHKDLIYDGWNPDTRETNYSYKDKDGNKKKATLDKENVYEMPNIGMIDHQSMGLLKNFLKDKGISLKEFLTNRKYMIVVTGDEYDDWPNMKMSGLIDMDFIIEEY